MYEFIRASLRESKKLTPVSEMALKGSARHDALYEVLNSSRDKYESHAAWGSGFAKLKIAGTGDGIVSLAHPYPEYQDYPADLTGANHIANDRAFIASLRKGERTDLNATMQWLQQALSRPRIKEKLEGNDAVTLAQNLQRASFSDSDTAKALFADTCEPILKRLMPEAFSNAEHALKKTVSRHLLKNIGDGDNPQDHIALSTRSSIALTNAVIDTLVEPGSKVILTVPFFDPFPAMLERAGAQVIAADTTKTEFKLQAKELRQLIEKHGMKQGDWLFMTSPNNVTMTPYSEKELQAIADVVAEKGIRVISDELYARLSPQPHVSLASLESWGPKGKVKLSDQVITVTGCSKQFPFGQEERRKLGAAYFADPAEAAEVDAMIKSMNLGVSTNSADMYRELIETTPGRIRTACCAANHKDQQVAEAMVNDINGSFTRQGKTAPLILTASEGGYLGSLSLAPEWGEKAGIRTSDDLTGYLLATTGIFSKSLTGEGVHDPVIRVNLNDFAARGDEVKAKLEHMLSAIDTGKAPPMAKVNLAINHLLQNNPRLTSEQIKHAQR